MIKTIYNLNFYSFLFVFFYLFKFPLQIKFQIKKIFTLINSDKKNKVFFSNIFLEKFSSFVKNEKLLRFLYQDSFCFFIFICEIILFFLLIFKNNKKEGNNFIKSFFFLISLEEIINTSFFFYISKKEFIEHNKNIFYNLFFRLKIVVFLIVLCVIIFINHDLFLKSNIINKNLQRSNMLFEISFFCLLINRIQNRNYFLIFFVLELVSFFFILSFLINLFIITENKKINFHKNLTSFKKENLIKFIYNNVSKLINFLIRKDIIKKQDHKLNFFFNTTSLILLIRFFSSFFDISKTTIYFFLSAFINILSFPSYSYEEISSLENYNFYEKTYYFFHFLSYLNKTSLTMFLEIKGYNPIKKENENENYVLKTNDKMNNSPKNKKPYFIELIYIIFFLLIIFNFIYANLIKKDEIIIKFIYLEISQKKLFFLMKNFSLFMFIKNFFFSIINVVFLNCDGNIFLSYDVCFFIFSTILLFFHYHFFLKKQISPLNKLTKLFLIENTTNIEKYFNNEKFEKFLNERYESNKNFSFKGILNLIYEKIKTFFLEFKTFNNFKFMVRIVSLVMIEIIFNSKLYLSDYIQKQKDHIYRTNFLTYVFWIKVKDFIFLFFIHVVYFIIERIFFIIFHFLFEKLKVRENIGKFVKENFKNYDLDFIFQKKLNLLFILMYIFRSIIVIFVFFYYLFSFVETSSTSFSIHFRLPFFLSFSFSFSSIFLISAISL